jgi:tRNA U54 and U55 pseudouridine synthase Pus10
MTYNLYKMKTFTIRVKSSSSEFHTVTIEISERIKVSCNCNAGVFGKLCKHKTAVLLGDIEILYDKSDEKFILEIQEIVKMSDYNKLVGELEIAQKAIETAKNQERKIKVKLEHTLKDGIKLNS